jgi:hypothetical protein
MDLLFSPARAIDAGVWAGTLPAAEAARLPGAPLKITGPHVVLMERPAWNGAALSAPFAGVSVLALGKGDAAIFLSAEAGHAATARETPGATATAVQLAPAEAPALPRRNRDRGADEVFVHACEELGHDLVRVARALLERIRATQDGALGLTDHPRKFVETPDNFWGVEVQPRRRAIKLIVRTSEERLLAAGLPYEAERPPSYWAMRVHGDGDVETALRFLALARER